MPDGGPMPHALGNLGVEQPTCIHRLRKQCVRDVDAVKEIKNKNIQNKRKNKHENNMKMMITTCDFVRRWLVDKAVNVGHAFLLNRRHSGAQRLQKQDPLPMKEFVHKRSICLKRNLVAKKEEKTQPRKCPYPLTLRAGRSLWRPG
jgi:hypothetical protein